MSRPACPVILRLPAAPSRARRRPLPERTDPVPQHGRSSMEVSYLPPFCRLVHGAFGPLPPEGMNDHLVSETTGPGPPAGPARPSSRLVDHLLRDLPRTA